MAAASKDKGPDTIELVSPDGERTVTVVADSAGDIKHRWNGFLPKEQAKLEAPAPSPTPAAPKTVGTNA